MCTLLLILTIICSSFLIWKCRNRDGFDKKLIKNPYEIIAYACSFLTYWAGLYNEVTQERILDGVEKLLPCAHMVLAN